MTTLRQIELRCPVCDNEFKCQSVVSTNAFGGKQRWVVDAAEQQRLDPREWFG